MRLLDTSTLAFWETYVVDPDNPALVRWQILDLKDNNIPRYAILSHRWGEDEVSYEDFVLAQQPAKLLPAWQAAEAKRIRARTGYWKIVDFCRTASGLGYPYCWIDTCCIDKRSSAELSEAINSMFTWYRRAARCIVYLADVRAGRLDEVQRDFSNSDWFTRCWTLQELLAPNALVFYDSSWSDFLRLTKRARAARTAQVQVAEWLADGSDALPALSTAASVSAACIANAFDRGDFSVAQIMSLASRRRATRTEDVAYSLLGPFNINMPLLYGEGYRAFTRLQHEIIRRSDDESIFAWRSSCLGGHEMVSITEMDMPFFGLSRNLLAPSPSVFARAANIIVSKRMRDWAYTITNRGLEITGVVWRSKRLKEDGVGGGYMHLACEDVEPDGRRRPCTIYIKAVAAETMHGQDHEDRVYYVENRVYSCSLDVEKYAEEGNVEAVCHLYAPIGL